MWSAKLPIKVTTQKVFDTFALRRLFRLVPLVSPCFASLDG